MSRVAPRRVAVLVSCFHGEKWIIEQLSSIPVYGEYCVDIWIRDDDPARETQAFLGSLNISSKAIKVFSDSRANLGAGRSFLELLWCLDGYDYYLFCDQDDIWLPSKISRQIQELERHGSVDEPMACFSDSWLLSDKRGILCGRYLVTTGLCRRVLTPWQYIYLNNVTGNSLCLSSGMRRLVLELGLPTDMVMHDWWVALIAAFLGRLHYIDEPLLLYRQHASNTIGAVSLSQRFFGGILGRKTAGASVIHRLAQAREFRRRAGDRLDGETLHRLDALLAASLPIQRLRLLWIRVKMLGLSTASRFHDRGD